MRRFGTPRAGALAGTLVLFLFLAACGGTDDNNTTDTTGDDGKVEKLSGAIVIDGSSTVAPISEAIAEEFRTEQKGVDVTVGTSGTGGGFKKFCADETDIADASRAIKDEEKQACEAAGVEYSEFRVGLDGLAVVTSADNTFLECLNTKQMADIFKEGGAATWDQIDPKFPKEKIAIFAPGTDSGTYDFFVEEVLGDPKKPESLKPRADYTASEDDNTLVQGIEGEKNSWGYFGFAYFKENKDKLKVVNVFGEDGECVAPSDETVESGDYPLSRPLFIYVKKTALARPEVKEFVKFYLETTPDLITDVGYTPAPAEDYKAGLELLTAGS
ncbi:MAG: PstS family phosphate ABC transporter substrate-binding protein [Acidimicrobiales bacterium]